MSLRRRKAKASERGCRPTGLATKLTTGGAGRQAGSLLQFKWGHRRRLASSLLRLLLPAAIGRRSKDTERERGRTQELPFR